MILEGLSINLIDKTNFYTGRIVILDNGMRVQLDITHEQVLDLIRSLDYKLGSVVRIDPRYGETFLPEEPSDGT